MFVILAETDVYTLEKSAFRRWGSGMFVILVETERLHVRKVRVQMLGYCFVKNLIFSPNSIGYNSGCRTPI